MAFAIAVGTVGFEIARQVLWPTIPLPEGNAIVGLRNWNVADSSPVPASRRDYELWRDGLSAITDLSAIEVKERSIAVGAGPGQPETVANVTASTFALTQVRVLPDDAQGRNRWIATGALRLRAFLLGAPSCTTSF